MPRIKASPKKCVKTSNSQQPSNTWVFLLKGKSPELWLYERRLVGNVYRFQMLCLLNRNFNRVKS